MLAITQLELHGVRNLASQAIHFNSRFNVFQGENGQGKTNVLEAIYIVATSRSFRTSSLQICQKYGESVASVTAQIVDDRIPASLTREQHVEWSHRQRQVQIDGKRPKTFAAFALATPVVLFEPSSLSLSQEGASERRRWLDRLAAHLEPEYGGGDIFFDHWIRYRQAYQRRRKLLEASTNSKILESYEHQMAEHGVAVMQARTEVVLRITQEAIRAFERITEIKHALKIDYVSLTPQTLEEFLKKLYETRADDARRGFSKAGPHLDDMSISLFGHSARDVASQGQHRAITLALKVAEISLISKAQQTHPIVLLDDVSSELDAKRNAALFEFLSSHVGQVLITTTQADLIAMNTDRKDFVVHAGMVREA